MKKRLVVTIVAMVVIFIVVLPIVPEGGLIAVLGIEGLERFNRLLPFVIAAISFMTPPAFYLWYYWRQTYKSVSPADERIVKRIIIPFSITFFLAGLGFLGHGLWQISILPLNPTCGISTGMTCLSFFIALGVIILMWREQRSDRATYQKTDRPEV